MVAGGAGFGGLGGLSVFDFSLVFGGFLVCCLCGVGFPGYFSFLWGWYNIRLLVVYTRRWFDVWWFGWIWFLVEGGRCFWCVDCWCRFTGGVVFACGVVGDSGGLVQVLAAGRLACLVFPWCWIVSVAGVWWCIGFPGWLSFLDLA